MRKHLAAIERGERVKVASLRCVEEAAGGGRAARGAQRVRPQSSAVRKEEGRAGDKPCAAEKLELDIDDAEYVTAFRGFFKPPFVVSTENRDDRNAESKRIY